MNIYKIGTFSVNYHLIQSDKALQIKSNHDLPLHMIDFFMCFPALSIIHKFHCGKQSYLYFEEYAYRSFSLFFFFYSFSPCFFGLRKPTNIPMPSGVQCKAATKIGCTMCLFEIHRISKHFGDVIKGWPAKYKGDCSTHKFQIISNMQIVKQTTSVSPLHCNL